MALQAIITQENLDVTKLKVSAWKSVTFTADADDVQFNCKVGEEYMVLICTKDTVTAKGRRCKAGEWYIVPITA